MNERTKQENKKPVEHWDKAFSRPSQKQEDLPDTFLSRHAIGRAQYDKSLGDLTEKMGMQDYKEALP